jgi:hypothetical protein
MKIRQGFVSNSSTTSFCIMGVAIDHPDFPEDHKYHEWDFYEVCEKNDLECYSMEYRSDYFVGLAPQNMKDDETVRDLKNRVLKNMEKIGIHVNYEELDWIQQAYWS